jgi:hypothetical protein
LKLRHAAALAQAGMDDKEKEEIVEEVLRRVWHRIAWGIVLIPIAYLIGAAPFGPSSIYCTDKSPPTPRRRTKLRS